MAAIKWGLFFVRRRSPEKKRWIVLDIDDRHTFGFFCRPIA
jgi:hypothetical protein